MLEYEYDEAISVLENSLKNASEKLVSPGVRARVPKAVASSQWFAGRGMREHTYGCPPLDTASDELSLTRRVRACLGCCAQKTTNEDLVHLRNQCITVEVNMARLFNADVKRRRMLKVREWRLAPALCVSTAPACRLSCVSIRTLRPLTRVCMDDWACDAAGEGGGCITLPAATGSLPEVSGMALTEWKKAVRGNSVVSPVHLAPFNVGVC